MPITTKQRIERRGYIGASDVAGLFGLDPYTTAYNLWAEKTGKLQDEAQEQDPNDVKNIGNLFEPIVIQWASGSLGEIETDIELKYKDPAVPLVSHLDGRVVLSGEVVEAKTSGMKGPLHEHWGEEHTDDIPYRIIVQTSAQMMCADTDIAHVPAFLGGRGFVMYKVGVEDQDIFQMIADRLGSFWNDNVLKDIPPDDSAPTMDIVKRIIRTPKKIVPVDEDLIHVWQKNRQARLDYEKKEKAALADVLAALGTAEAGECDMGLVTYLEQGRKSLDSKELKRLQPETYIQFLKESRYRVARFKTRK